MKIQNLSFYLKYENLLLALLPFSIILGNFVLNLNIILIILLYLYFNFKNIFSIENLKKLNFFLIFLIFFLVLNASFSENLLLTLKGQLGLIKHLILYSALCYFFLKNVNTLKMFISILTISILFTLFDTFWQFLFSKDLFGHNLIESHGNRLSGPFGDEYIVGGFILKTIFFTSNQKFFKQNYNWIFYIVCSYIIVILASQRMPTILFSFSLFFLFFLDKRFNFKLIFYSFIVILIITLVTFNFNSKIKKHYIDRTMEQVGIYEGDNHKNFWDSQWGAHYLTSIEIFKDSKLLGSGIKTFRNVCNKENYSNIDSVNFKNRCSTHPHNIYFEILAETGVVGVIFFLYLIIRFIKFTKILKLNFIKDNPEVFILIFIFFWPLQSTGSLFSSWNGFFYPLFFSYVYCMSKKYYYKNI
jgi:O-antigen ligase